MKKKMFTKILYINDLSASDIYNTNLLSLFQHIVLFSAIIITDFLALKIDNFSRKILIFFLFLLKT